MKWNFHIKQGTNINASIYFSSIGSIVFFLLSHQLQAHDPRPDRIAPGLHCFDEGQSPSHLPT